MTAMPTMRNIANFTPANAVDVDWNFETIETHLGSQVINRDGSVAMAGELLLAGNPSSNLGAAPKQYVDSLLPAGLIVPFAGSAAPVGGWLLCDGSVVSQATYAALFAVCGTTYNTGGEGAGNFRLPNLKTRMPVGRDSGTAPFQTLGGTGGSKDSVNISHSHTVSAHSHTIDHDHPSGNTGNVSNDHTHFLSTITDTQGAHDHQTYSGSNNGWFQFGGGNLGPKSPGDFTTGWNISSPTRTSTDGGHQHNISANTGGVSANHTHTFDVANFAGSSGSAGGGSTSTDGSAGTNLNLPPYLIVNYIVKT